VSEAKYSNIKVMDGGHAKMGNPAAGISRFLDVSKNSSLGGASRSKCEPQCEPITSLRRRANGAGFFPVAIVADEKSGRERAVYPGQSADAVALRCGFKDYTVEALA